MTDAQSMPSGRVRRAAKVGGLVGGEVARSYATQAANLVRSEEIRGTTSQLRRQNATTQVPEVLVQMKGPATKLASSRARARARARHLRVVGRLSPTAYWHSIMIEWVCSSLAHRSPRPHRSGDLRHGGGVVPGSGVTGPE
jgi:hypothetical protein